MLVRLLFLFWKINSNTKIYKIIMSQDVTVLMYIKEWVVNGERKNNYF